jgi:phage recombination protein Bet
MSREIEKQEKLNITISDIKTQFCPKATDKELDIALGVIKAFQLNPYKKEVHLIKYSENSPLEIVVGYEVYIKRAERSGKLNGWKAENTDTGAKITIKRKDWETPFEWEVENVEFDKKQSTWVTQPKFQIKKVAISQGFRLCFPDECGGLPYTKEEFEIIEAVATDITGGGKPDVTIPTAKKGDSEKVIEKDEPNRDSYITGPQKKKIFAMLHGTKQDEGLFLQMYNIDSVEDLKKELANEAFKRIDNKEFVNNEI